MIQENMLRCRVKQSKAEWIELLRILACFCIILLHVSAEAWYNVKFIQYNGLDIKLLIQFQDLV